MPSVLSKPKASLLNSGGTSGQQLFSNCLWNFVGLTAPLLVAAIAIPQLVRGLGADKFGFLTIAWSLIGYFSLFDLGLGRALTKLVAEKLGTGRTTEVPSALWTAILLMAGMGCLGAVALALVSSFLVTNVLKIPTLLQHQTLICLYLIAVTIPVVTVTAGFRGLLEAKQQFAGLSLVRIAMGIVTFLGPLAVLPYSNNLPPSLAVLVIARFVTLLAYVAMSIHTEPMLLSHFQLSRSVALPLLRFGGWMTVSNLLSPIMASLDRFIIGSLLSIGAVTYYATPQEVVTKLSLIPSAVVGVLFPAFSAALAGDEGRARSLYSYALRFSLLSLLPFALAIILFAKEGLTLWLGAGFAAASTRVAQLLTLGVVINALAVVPFAYIQAAGRPDLTAKLHMAEVPIYLAMCFWLIRHFGIQGAAIAWTLRIAIDTAACLFIAHRWAKEEQRQLWPNLFWLAALIGGFVMAIVSHSVIYKLIFLSTFAAVYVSVMVVHVAQFRSRNVLAAHS